MGKLRIALSLVFIFLFVPVCTFAQQENKPAGPHAPNFVDNKDGTITDKKTGLVWKRCPEGISGADCSTGKAEKFKWQVAIDNVKALNEGEGFAGKKDWRIPTIEELETILDNDRKDPSINMTAFPNTPFDSFYWSSSVTEDVQNASAALFSIGKRIWSFKFDSGYVRLVRAGNKPEEKKKDPGEKSDEKKKDAGKKSEKSEEGKAKK